MKIHANIRCQNEGSVCSGKVGSVWSEYPPKKKKSGPLSPPPIAPVKGQQAFIDLATENPLDFFLLDLQTGSFEFAELPAPATTDYLRAKYTLETLELNKKAFLRKAREEAYGDYKARFKVYIQDKKNGTPQIQLNVMIVEIKTHSHPTVWKEMIRQKDHIPELHYLFNQAPEALLW